MSKGSFLMVCIADEAKGSSFFSMRAASSCHSERKVQYLWLNLYFLLNVVTRAAVHACHDSNKTREWWISLSFLSGLGGQNEGLRAEHTLWVVVSCSLDTPIEYWIKFPKKLRISNIMPNSVLEADQNSYSRRLWRHGWNRWKRRRPHKQTTKEWNTNARNTHSCT